MRRRAVILLGLWFVGCVASHSEALAIDVAFWAPYRSDAHTYALLHLDQKNLAEAEGFAKIEKVELLGDAAFDPAGKFAGALRLRGAGALRAAPAAVFPGAYLSIEAWVKLERYPEKEACLVFRPAGVGKGGPYNPDVDVTKGFALLLDAQGAFHLETTNCQYRKTVRTSSPEGVVPLGQWVHLAGVSDQFPVGFRRLYVNGRQVQEVPIAWGEGLMVGDDEEKKPGVIYIGNNDRQTAGLAGWIDEVRIHTKIVKLWEKDAAWPSAGQVRPVAGGPPHFLPSHQPIVYLPLDGDARDVAGRVPDLKIEAAGDHFVPGVRGKAWSGPLALSAPKLLDLAEGSIEFWLQPVGVNNLTDNNRNFLGGPFILYFYNDGGGLALKPLTLYFSTPAGLHFLRDDLETEFHPGAWYHLVTTWKDQTITLYINGRQAGKTFNRSLVTPENKGSCDRLQLLPHEPIGIVDEVRIYDKALLPEEAANAYFRYRQPERLSAEVRAKAVEIQAQFMPSTDSIYCRATPNLPPEKIGRIRLTLTDAARKELLRKEVPFSATEQSLVVPELADGQFALSADVVTPQGTIEPGDKFQFVRKHFAWEKNTLGITDEVYAPFEAIRTKGNDVSVVGRTYTMNGFGLWDRAVTLGRDILAGPMRLRFVTADGEGAWTNTRGAWTIAQPKKAVFAAAASADAVQVTTLSTIEVDGCMQVDAQLMPGSKPAEIRKLWIEIPLRADEVPLLHTIGDGLRHNYAGKTPQGSGVVWDGSQAVRTGPWRNCFVPYVWLGAEERGLAWFGENDKGWITEKHKSKTPTHELVRQRGAVLLKVYLINRPVTLTEPRKLRFGLQASPTKPLPADWRRLLPEIPGGLAVVPFGGLQCASQGPLRDDWQIVDKILACRGGQPLDDAWLTDYTRRHKPPLVHGNWDWSNSVGHFAQRARQIGPHRPLTVYQEEMSASAARPDYAVFQDEWNASPHEYGRVWLDAQVIDQGYAALGKPVEVTFGPSYRDFGCWFAHEWLRRGVSLYWDNTYPHLSTNFRTTDAYLAEDGQIQPCLILWNQRAYQQRVWNLVQQWRRQRPEPLHYVLHMTNTLVLPIHTWGTADLDHELSSDKPFSPEWLRTETTGRQIGNLPLSLYAVAGSQNKVLARLSASLPRPQLDQLRQRIEWGMRVVHEIQHSGPLEKFLTDFGYGSQPVTVHNYWEQSPVLTVKPDAVKWIALAKPAEKSLLIVLASWSEEEVAADISVQAAALGFEVRGARVIDPETGKVLVPALSGPLAVRLPAPYGVRIVRLAPATAPGAIAPPARGG